MSNISEEIKAVAADLELTVSQFDDEQFNRVPFEGSWTAGQVAEHIAKSLVDVPRILLGKTAEAGREPEANVKMIRDLFLNFDTRMKSPDFILPSDGHDDSKELSAKINKSLNAIAEIAGQQDLKLLCTWYDFPGVGKLTRVELINFISVHTQRHVHQMKNIKARL